MRNIKQIVVQIKNGEKRVIAIYDKSYMATDLIRKLESKLTKDKEIALEALRDESYKELPIEKRSQIKYILELHIKHEIIEFDTNLQKHFEDSLFD